jgi:outer membrane protein OmpA-like peptidoglycan-associated protein
MQGLVLIALAIFAPQARAQRGIDVHGFEPTVDASGYFTVERSDTTPPGLLGFKLTVDYANNPLSARLTDATTLQLRRATLMDWQLVGTIGVTLGLTRWLAALLQAPVSMQSFSAAYGSPGDRGITGVPRSGFASTEPRTNIGAPNAGPLDMRLGLKARVVRVGPVGLGALAVVTLPFGDETAFLGDAGYTFRPRVVGDLKLGRFYAAVNLGAIVRQTTRVLDPYDVASGAAPPHVLLEVGHELTWSVATGWRLTRWLSLAAELYAHHPLAVSRDARVDHTLDVIGGAQLTATREVAFSVGAGAGVLTDAARNDQFRVFAGVSWSPAVGLALSREEVAARADHAMSPEDDGSPDDDHDGIPNRVDRCPRAAEDFDSFQDEDGCPDPDNDGDGVLDVKDRCPFEAEDHDGFQDEDGCPDPDNDGDGIADAQDKCPNEPETRNGIDDEDGCPEANHTLATPTGAELPPLPEISFAVNDSRLDAKALATLGHVADRLLAYSAIGRVRIEGHADPKEAPGQPRRQALSQARADGVRSYLIGRGIDAARLQAVGYGSTRPVDSSGRAEGRARNRRVELIVVER